MQALPDILSGTLIPVAVVAKRRTGSRPSRATIWRWINKGTRGGKLDAVHHGGQWRTTAEAFDDFLSRQTEAARYSETPQNATDDDLRAAGLL